MKIVFGGMIALFGMAGAAQAAVYRYDVTMARSSLSIWGAYTYVNGPPENLLPGLYCDDDDNPGYCDGTLDLSDVGLDFGDFDKFDPIISGILTVYPNHNADAGTGRPPECSGSALLCEYVGAHDADSGLFSYTSGSADGFSLYSADYNYGFYTDADAGGLTYGDECGYSLTINGIDYECSGYSGLNATYVTTSFAVISPVPLPAGIALFPAGLLLLGLFRRRSGTAA